MFFKLLKHPMTAFIAIILGIFYGIYFPDSARSLGVFSDAYLLLLQMTIVPILVSAIISSVGHFIQNHNFPKVASRAWKTILISMLFTVVLGLAFSIVLEPSALSEEGSDYLSRYIGNQTDVLIVNLDDRGLGNTNQQGFFNIFINALIPSNLFNALVEGKALSLAFISIVIGVAAGFNQVRRRREGRERRAHASLLLLCDNIFVIFQQIISAVLVFLPVALVLIIAKLIATNGVGIFAATFRLIATFYLLGIILLLLGSIVLTVVTKRKFSHILKISLAPAFLGFMTKSSVATIPACIENLKSGLEMKEDLAKLLVPLFLVLCRFGNLAYFAVVTIFSVQIYQIDIGVVEFIVLILSLIFASIATAGATGFATLNVISIAFLPLGIPVETMLVILYAIDPIIDPIRTMLIVHTNFVTIGITGNNLSTVDTADILAPYHQGFQSQNASPQSQS